MSDQPLSIRFSYDIQPLSGLHRLFTTVSVQSLFTQKQVESWEDVQAALVLESRLAINRLIDQLKDADIIIVEESS